MAMLKFAFSLLFPIIINCLFMPGSMAQSQQGPEELSSLENLVRFDVSDPSIPEISFNSPIAFTDPSLIMGQITEVVVDESGRVFVADRDNSSVYMFDKDGKYITTIGGEGDGPGEFRSLRNLAAGSGYLHAFDMSQRRITRFDLETLQEAGTTALSGDEPQTGGFNMSRFPNGFYLMPDGNYLLSFSAFTFPGMGGQSDDVPMLDFDILTPGGEYLGFEGIELRANESVTSASGNSFRVIMPSYAQKAFTAVSPDGRIYTNWSEELLVKEYDVNGTYQRAFFSEYRKPAIDRDELLASAKETYDEASYELLKEQEFPETWPAVQHLLADDSNRLWIALYTGNDMRKWVVFNIRSGKPEAVFELPSNHRIQQLKGEYVYVLEPDSDGFDSVKRYKVKF
jgi:hypothetical protein